MEKVEFETKPQVMESIEHYGFSWIDFVTAIPSPLFVVTSYKSNGLPNACLQSWSTFVGDEQGFYCIMAAVNKNGHMYQTIRERGDMVLNFPDAKHFNACSETIRNNQFEDDEIIQSGLSIEKAVSVDAPRIAECFLNLEARYLWEKDLRENGSHVVLCAEVTRVCMDAIHFNEQNKGRYNETGYIYNVHSPVNPLTGEAEEDSIAIPFHCARLTGSLTDRHH